MDTVYDEQKLVRELAADGWLGEYVKWAREQSDCPPIFHLGAGLCILGASAGNRLCTHAWGNDIYPNLWMCFIAPSGFYRKSTGVRFAAKLFAQVAPGKVLPDDFSREQFVADLAKIPDGLMVSTEFGELIRKMGRDYMQGTREMLTALFDGDDYIRRTMKDSARVEKPAFSILAASTEDWISDRVSEGDLRGGFLSRFLFLPGAVKSATKGIGDEIDYYKRDDLIRALRGRTQVAGQANFNHVKRLLNETVNEFEQAVNENPNPRLMGFYSRAGLYLLKLSMCFQLSSDFRNLTIGEEAARKAIFLWRQLAEAVRYVIEERLTTGKMATKIKECSDILKRHEGEMRHSALLRATHWDTKELKLVTDTMIQSDLMTARRERTGDRGPATIVYKLLSVSNNGHHDTVA